jgi:transcriptional regulator with GAF, ATPase, and Fis domain
MIAVQEMCGRVALVTSKGLSAIIKVHYPKWLLYSVQVLDRFDTCQKTGEQSGEDAKALTGMEQDHILQVLHKTAWRIEGPTGAAVLLGLNPSTLRARMRKYGIRRQ